ncbi:uncharacterized protein [Primulina eburnea]|uniref:uncharacterized protein n=1 Tax=Primulina eburnea TaxID=1245227 RepID=UPI003C6C9133
MEKTIPGTSQQNGVPERMNMSLNECARSIRLHSGLPKSFWDDAINTIAYLINRGSLMDVWSQTSSKTMSFEDFSTAFLHRFASSKRHQKNYLSLAALEISAATPEIMISAFTHGLRGGEFFKSLVKKPPSSYDDLLARAEKYVNLEDAQQHRRMEQQPGESRVEGAERGGRKRGARERYEDKARSGGQFSSHVPLDRSRDKVMEVREPERRWEKSQRVEINATLPSRDRREGSSSGSRQRSRMSLRHGQGPPWTNQRVGEQRVEGRGQDVPQEPVEPRRKMNEDNHPARGMIRIISGGATDEDSGFGPEDLRGIVTPHNDALVVTATIANYDVAMIFFDNGSSVNVLFKNTLDQVKVEGFEFESVSTALYGFAGHAIPPLGQIVLPISLDTDPRRVTKMIAFIVVDTPSAYNGIIGWPSLKDFRAVASTYHQKLKFSVGKGV